MSLKIGTQAGLPPQRVEHRALRFTLSQVFSVLWVAAGVLLSLPWVTQFADIIDHAIPVLWLALALSILVIAGIAYIPGYLIAFMTINILFRRSVPEATNPNYYQVPAIPVSVIIAARNEAKNIVKTLESLSQQTYLQHAAMDVIVVDNGSTDGTFDVVSLDFRDKGLPENMALAVFNCKTKGKNFALNYGLQHVERDWVITLDADTILEPNAIANLMMTLVRSRDEDFNVVAIAGSLGVSNVKESIWTRLQHWDYFLAIASIKRLQGMFNHVLVAQGAFSVYQTKALRNIDGWPDAIGEDIVVTWNLMRGGARVLFAPDALGHTSVPSTFRAFAKQRARWARGMLEAIGSVKPWQHKNGFTKFLAGVDLVIPFLDIVYTFCWIPGLILACFGIFWLVGPMTLLVLPLTVLVYAVLWAKQRKVYRTYALKYNRNLFYFVLFLFGYQLLMSPVSTLGYCQYWFRTKRSWK